MNNKISNQKKEVPNGIFLNEKDYLNSLLGCLKEMSRNYTIAMEEASNEKLYNIYRGVFLEIISLQREVFEVMFRNGWYEIERAEDIKINTKYQMLLQEYQNLDS